MKITRSLKENPEDKGGLMITEHWNLELSDSELLKFVVTHREVKEAFREFLRIIP